MNIIKPILSATMVCALLCSTIGCSIVSTPDIDIEVTFSDKSDDGSRTVEAATTLGKAAIHFGSARITPWSVTSINEQGDSLSTVLWTPAGTDFDTATVAVLVHGSDAPLIGMYPLAIELIKQKLPVLLISMRGTNRNAHLATTTGLADIADVSDVLSAYAGFTNTTDIRAAIFGTSLGGVVALNAGVSDTRIVAIACEGMWYNTEKVVSKFLNSDAKNLYRQNKQAYQEKQPATVLGVSISKPVFLLWGSNDHLTAPEEMQKMVELARSHQTPLQYRIVESGKPLHAVRLPTFAGGSYYRKPEH